MAREPESKTINGAVWEVHPWPGMYGVRMQQRWGKVLAPAIEAATSHKSAADLFSEAAMSRDLSEFAPVIGTAVASLLESTNEDTPQLIKDSMHGAVANGQDLSQQRIFDDHFTQNYGELYQGLAFILQVNFGSFFGLAGAIGARVSQGNPDQGQPENSTSE